MWSATVNNYQLACMQQQQRRVHHTQTKVQVICVTRVISQKPGYLGNVKVCLVDPWAFHQMLHLLRQLSRQPHRSLDPWCCPHWGVNGNSGLQSPTPDRCHLRGRFQITGASPWAGGSGCCPALWADRGCWWWSPRCSPEGCWPDRGHYSGPTLWGSYQRWLFSG